MITIELELLSITRNFEILNVCYKEKLLRSNEWHFLFEPQLIIRINPDVDKLLALTELLKKKGYSFHTYKYPSPMYDKNNKITKLFGDEAFNPFIVTSLNNTSRAYMEMTGAEYERFIERTWHCMNNIAAKEWDEEGVDGLRLAKSRLIKGEKWKLWRVILQLLVI